MSWPNRPGSPELAKVANRATRFPNALPPLPLLTSLTSLTSPTFLTSPINSTTDLAPKRPQRPPRGRFPVVLAKSAKQEPAPTQQANLVPPSDPNCYHSFIRFNYEPILELAVKEFSGIVVAICRFPGAELQALSDKLWKTSGNDYVPRVSHVFEIEVENGGGKEVVVVFEEYTVTLEHVARVHIRINDNQFFLLMNRILMGIKVWQEQGLKPRLGPTSVFLSREGLVKVGLDEPEDKHKHDILNDIYQVAFKLLHKRLSTAEEEKGNQKVSEFETVNSFFRKLKNKRTKLSELQDSLHQGLNQDVRPGRLIELWHRSMVSWTPLFDKINKTSVLKEAGT